MNITDVRVRLLKNDEGKMKASASIVIDNDFVIHDIKIIEGADKNFISMPSRRTKDGEYRDIAHPLRTEVREELAQLILLEYEKEKAKEPV